MSSRSADDQRLRDLSVTEVRFAVGCSSLGTFNTPFTELLGVPPSTYRTRHPGAAQLPDQTGHQTDQGSGSAHPAAATGGTAMTISIHYAFLPYTDADAAPAFYRGTLGFEVRNDIGYDDMRWLTVGPPNQPGTSWSCTPPAVDPGITDDEHRTILELIAKGSYGASDDLNGLFDRLQASGADVVQEPTEQPYGVRDCAFRDPTGNLIRTNELR